MANDQHPMSPRLPRTVAVVLLVLLLIGAFFVLRPFLISVAWAGILVSTTWPLHRRLLGLLEGKPTLSASLMTLALVVTIVGPAATIAWMITAEASRLVEAAQAALQQGPPHLPAWLTNLPLIGEKITRVVKAAWEDPQMVKDWLASHREVVSSFAFSKIGDVGRNLGKIAVSLLTAYFLYRHGEVIVRQLRIVIDRFAGPSVRAHLATVGITIRAVVYGILMTALAQGVLAGIGFWFTGVGAPVLLGIATCFASLIPFGPPFVWLPAAIWLLARGDAARGLVLLAWGALVVSTIDNVLRPYFISQATKLPILMIFFGVLGGVSAFGLIGLFVGPIILVILLVLWREWASHSTSATS
jgi:predicted PurR-regulated permease PerM